MACCYVVSFTHPDTGSSLRYYGASSSIERWADECPSRLLELVEWFGVDSFHVAARTDHATIEQARRRARRLSFRLKLHLRRDWLNGDEFKGSRALLGDLEDRRGDKNPMHGRAHRPESRAAMSRARARLRWVHQGSVERQVTESERAILLSTGWRAGRPKKGR